MAKSKVASFLEALLDLCQSTHCAAFELSARMVPLLFTLCPWCPALNRCLTSNGMN